MEAIRTKTIRRFQAHKLLKPEFTVPQCDPTLSLPQPRNANRNNTTKSVAKLEAIRTKTIHRFQANKLLKPEFTVPQCDPTLSLPQPRNANRNNTTKSVAKLEAKLQLQETQHQETQHQETQHRETQHQETQHRETQHQETQHQETQHRETQHRETQHQETQHRETQHQETQHQETQHRETQHQETQHRETQHQETQHQETQHRETQHRETQHQETQHRETQHQETQHQETQHQETQYQKTQHPETQHQETRHRRIEPLEHHQQKEQHQSGVQSKQLQSRQQQSAHRQPETQQQGESQYQILRDIESQQDASPIQSLQQNMLRSADNVATQPHRYIDTTTNPETVLLTPVSKPQKTFVGLMLWKRFKSTNDKSLTRRLIPTFMKQKSIATKDATFLNKAKVSTPVQAIPIPYQFSTPCPTISTLGQITFGGLVPSNPSPLISAYDTNTSHSNGLVTVATSSTSVYSPKEGIYIGHEQDIQPPATIKTDWLEVRERLIKDLRPVLQSLPHVLPRHETVIELDLYMAGEATGKSSRVTLRPTILIRCGGKQCQKSVQKAIKDLNYLPNIAISVQISAPRPAGTSKGAWIATAKAGSSSFCGLEVRMTSGDGFRMCRIGGLVKVDGTIYGLTTAHSMFKAEPRVDDTDEISIIQHIESATRNTEAEIWAQANITLASYSGHPVIGGHLAGLPASDGTDIALIAMNLHEHEVFNHYRKPASRENGKREPCLIKDIPSILEAGEVCIICSTEDVRPGFLLDDDAMFFDRAGTFNTKKIRTEAPLELGLSGTWVTRGSDLLGVIVAVYENEPYAHMLPIRQVFSDIQSLLTQDEICPEVGISLGRSSTVTNSKDELSEQDASRNNHQFPTLPVVLNKQRKFSLAVISIGLCLTSFVLGLDITLFPTIMPAITDKFNSSAQMGLYGSAYLLAMCLGYLVFAPLHVHLDSELMDFSLMHLISFVLFELGSLLCGFASNSAMILAGRAITGIGAAGGIMGVVTVVVECVPVHQKKLPILLVVHGFGLGRLFGPLVGGAFGHDYQRSFYAIAATSALGNGAIAMTLWDYKHTTRTRSLASASIHYRPRSGQVSLLLLNIFFVAAPLFLYLALYFGATVSWKDAQALTSFFFLGSLLLFVGILVLFPKRSYPRGRITYSSWTMLILSTMWGASFFTFNHFLPIWLQAVQGCKPRESSINTLATMGALYCATAAITMLYALNPPSRWKYLSSSHLIISFVLMGLGSGLSSTFQIHTPLGRMIGYQILFGVGAGLGSFQAMAVTLSLVLPKNGHIGSDIESRHIGSDIESRHIGSDIGSRHIGSDIESRHIGSDIGSRHIGSDIESRHIGSNIESRHILKIITRSAIAETLGGASAISIAQTVFLGQAIPGQAFIQKIGATNFRDGLEGPVLDASVAAFNKAITRTFLVAAAPNAFAFVLCVLSGIIFFRLVGRSRREGNIPPGTTELSIV